MIIPALSLGIDAFEPEKPTFQPVRTLEIELSKPLPTIASYDGNTERYYRLAQILVRLHTQPLGLVELNLDKEGLSADVYADKIWLAFHQEINNHLRMDGLPEVIGLSLSGLQYSDLPPCMQARTQFLAEAPHFSVVVCSRDRTEQLSNCLPSLLALDYPSYEIIVIDNAPQTSATADLIGQCYNNLPQVRYIREDRPGLSWARNCALQHSTGQFVAYTDDDVIADPDWLANLAMGFKITDNVACVTGLTLPAELETQAQVWFEQYGGLSKGIFSELIFDISEHRPDSLLFPYSSGIFGSGVNMAFETSILRDTGGFDPALGTGTVTRGGEDLAMFVQLIISGYRIVYEPGALIYHFHRKEYSSLKLQIYSNGVGMLAFLTKCIVDHPKRLFDIGRKLPHGLKYVLSKNSPKNRKKMSSYPAKLTNLELKGMLYGPFSYLRSRWRLRHIMQEFAPLQVSMQVSPDPLVDIHEQDISTQELSKRS